jgi:hypothetical protein
VPAWTETVTIDMPLGADSVAVDGTKPRPNDVTEGRYTGVVGFPRLTILAYQLGSLRVPLYPVVGHDILHPIFIS